MSTRTAPRPAPAAASHGRPTRQLGLRRRRRRGRAGKPRRRRKRRRQTAGTPATAAARNGLGGRLRGQRRHPRHQSGTGIAASNTVIAVPAAARNVAAPAGAFAGLYVGIGSSANIDNSGSPITITGDILAHGLITITGAGTSVVQLPGHHDHDDDARSASRRHRHVERHDVEPDRHKSRTTQTSALRKTRPEPSQATSWHRLGHVRRSRQHYSLRRQHVFGGTTILAATSTAIPIRCKETSPTTPRHTSCKTSPAPMPAT